MDSTQVESRSDHLADVKTVKCSMCRKVKTSDHFVNPNSTVLFHVCDYCRYLRKTKYKSKSPSFCMSVVERRVKVELERPSSTTSRSRESSALKSSSLYVDSSSAKSRSTAESRASTPPAQSFAGIVPSKKWIVISTDSTHTPSDRQVTGGGHASDTRYTLNHPYYKYQSILSTLCMPPQIVMNNDNSVVILRPSIPPAPKSLIFCCNSSLYSNRFGMYDRIWMSDSC